MLKLFGMNKTTGILSNALAADASIEPAQVPEQIYTLTLKAGIKVKRGQQQVSLRTVRLRDITHADEQAAVAAAERVVVVNGQPRILVSEAAFKTMLAYHRIDALLGADGTSIERLELSPEIIGRLDPLDWLAIEQRSYLVELAGQLRYGLIDQAEFDRYMQGVIPEAAPQPVGQAAAAGEAAAQPVPGPVMLSDLTAPGAAGAGHGVG